MFEVMERGEGHAVVRIEANGERFSMAIPSYLPTQAHRTEFVKTMATQRALFVIEQIHQARMAYQLLPWWKKIFTRKPK